MVLKTTNNSSLGEVRRPNSGKLDLSPLGKDPKFVSMNFEIEAKLKPESDAALCDEGQEAKGTTTYSNGTQSIKRACSAGNTSHAKCLSDSDCDVNKKCKGGVKNGESCDKEARRAHFIPERRDLLKPENFDKFLDQRRSLLAKAINKLVG